MTKKGLASVSSAGTVRSEGKKPDRRWLFEDLKDAQHASSPRARAAKNEVGD